MAKKKCVVWVKQTRENYAVWVKQIQRVCVCGRKFEVDAAGYNISRRRYCSIKCSDDGRRAKIRDWQRENADYVRIQQRGRYLKNLERIKASARERQERVSAALKLLAAIETRDIAAIQNIIGEAP